jgi:hypothetical protein
MSVVQSVDFMGDPSDRLGKPVEGEQEQLVPLVSGEVEKPETVVPVGTLESLNGAAKQFGDFFFQRHKSASASVKEEATLDLSS